MQIHSFPPIINNECRILILGSMPGVESLRKNEYYGHPQNQFWRIMFDLSGEKLSDDYETKKQLLLEKNIALWDVISNCVRKGSLDSAIKEDMPNDFEQLYIEYSNIKHVFFNGAKAYDTYRRKVGFDDTKTFIRLSSTSPANAIKYDKKREDWGRIKKLINDRCL